MKNQISNNTNNFDFKKNIFKRSIQVLMSIFLISALLFISAGKINFTYAWIYIALSIMVIIINLFIFPAELIAERGRNKDNVETWDKILTRLIMLPFLSLYIVAGLDIRFGWSPKLDIWIHITGLALFLLGNAIVSWAMVSNPYFSTAVCIQHDRNHSVSKGGPYKYIRHPGYLGMIIYYIATPLFLGSLWSFIPAFLTSILFIIRTALEDNTLKNKLDGYANYALKVRYRIIPGIW